MVELWLEATWAGDTPQGDTRQLSPCPAKRGDMPLPGWGGPYLGCWWPCRPLSGRHPGRQLRPAPWSWDRESEGGELSGRWAPRDVPVGPGTEGGVSPVPPPGHSPQLGVQLGGLRVEILPDGVGALQGRKGTVTSGAPRHPAPPPRGGSNPPLHRYRETGQLGGRAWLAVASLMANKG